ncbi:MAG: Na/Pi cotransporter family protein [Candidatus Omnitrophica bacterium]|nr:Na/Pi cotransporter family protein [Candidatus Omnitrophota bacterium]
MDPLHAPSTLELGALLTGLAGGLALFLFGMRRLVEALKAVAGGRMKRILSRLTTNRFSGLAAGLLVTSVIQSSSLTTVLVVGFITAGLMTSLQAVGVILGAGIGTTVTVQIIAFKVTHYGLILIAVGFFVELVARGERSKYCGAMLMGLGLIFFGMDLMSQATYPLRGYAPFIELMKGMQTVGWGVLWGAVFTGIIQSSAATIGLAIVLASQGFLNLEASIALVFGANIGTCVTALLAAIEKPRPAVRAAMVHILIKILGVLLWIAFVPQMAEFVRSISPAAVQLEGAARLSAELPRQIANAHTLFNLVNAAVFIWFVRPLDWLAGLLVPRGVGKEELRIKPEHLQKVFLEEPDLALDQVRLELNRLGLMALGMVRISYTPVLQGSTEDMSHLKQLDKDVDALHAQIISYLGQLSMKKLVPPQPKKIYLYIATANYIENIGDVVQTNLVGVGKNRLARGVEVSPATQAILEDLYVRVCEAGELTLKALLHSDPQEARRVRLLKREFKKRYFAAQDHLADRLVAEEEKRLSTFRIENDLIDSYVRIHALFRRIASVVEEVGHLD